MTDYESSQGGWDQVGYSINGETVALNVLSHIPHYNPINRQHYFKNLFTY